MFERPHMKKLQNQQKQSKKHKQEEQRQYEKITTPHPFPTKKKFLNLPQ